MEESFRNTKFEKTRKKLSQEAGIELSCFYRVKLRKNHYPLLKKLLDKGDVLSIKAETPIIHSSEDSRWDFKVIITFKTEHLALDYSIVDPFKKQLFPDEESYKKAEQHRFELVIAHWDVPVETVVLD